MRGRDVFMKSLLANDVKYIFGNPGTTESPIIDSLPAYPDLSYIMTLHEGIATGAAAFYAQASGRVGVANLHVAPGLGNAIGMIFAGLKANAPMIITAGQQDTRLRLRGPILGHDLVEMANPVVKWSVQVERASELAEIMRRAFKIATDVPKGPVFVSLPIDIMEEETKDFYGDSGKIYKAASPDPLGIEEFTLLLLDSKNPAIILGDNVARSGAERTATELIEVLGAEVWLEGLRAQSSFCNDHPNFCGTLPFDSSSIAKALGTSDLVLLVGGPFFEEVWYTEGSPFPKSATILQIEENVEALARNQTLVAGLLGETCTTLRALLVNIQAKQTFEHKVNVAARNDILVNRKKERIQNQINRLHRSKDRRPMSMAVAMSTLSKILPQKGVVVDESITASADLERSFAFTQAGDYFSGRGGGIGQGLAGAIGVQLAFPNRRVACISGDGSAMYSIQALWTAAHHNLPVIFIILANREYRVLKHNIDIYRKNFSAQSNSNYVQMDLTIPKLDFVKLASSMGINGQFAAEPDEIMSAIGSALLKNDPFLLEIEIEGKL